RKFPPTIECQWDELEGIYQCPGRSNFAHRSSFLSRTKDAGGITLHGMAINPSTGLNAVYATLGAGNPFGLAAGNYSWCPT
ncbi:MAG TPA: hypothetical protein PLP17_13120, partial [Oligoflexia bacterium]|nr:hypothetical protein [Oligoflexia bacterium]